MSKLYSVNGAGRKMVAAGSLSQLAEAVERTPAGRFQVEHNGERSATLDRTNAILYIVNTLASL